MSASCSRQLTRRTFLQATTGTVAAAAAVTTLGTPTAAQGRARQTTPAEIMVTRYFGSSTKRSGPAWPGTTFPASP
jgi:hypothetical protein